MSNGMADDVPTAENVPIANDWLTTENGVEMIAVGDVFSFFFPLTIFPIFQEIYITFKSNSQYVCITSKSFLGGSFMIENYINNFSNKRQGVCKGRFHILKVKS